MGSLSAACPSWATAVCLFQDLFLSLLPHCFKNQKASPQNRNMISNVQMAAVSVSRFRWVVISLRNPEISETLKTNISRQCWEEHTALISGENRGSDMWNNELQATNHYLKECLNLTDGGGTRRRQIWKKCYCLRNFFLITHPGNIYLAFPPIWSEGRHRNSTDSKFYHGDMVEQWGHVGPMSVSSFPSESQFTLSAD